MNDDELITAVKESVTGVHMTTPAGQIVRRSRAIRARRQIPALAGSLAVAAGAALALAALLPAGHQPGHSRLAAWTVAKQPGGAISVTIHQLRDPAGLQSTLRADGLPATVGFSVSGPPLNPSCQPHPATKPLLSSVFPVLTPTGHIRLVINPSALPSGAGVSIFDLPHAPHGVKPHRVPVISVGLVRASQECTGS